ncbi:aspartate/glutamate racemase family protein [uncultured Castellaniella sp.]|uniref:aspartate/glutamate racemase family protein n=1 Tax=uncultured Castellaniella sp. TaxID=647907 RepID=UPI002605F19D|nr:aspartate/glutamate racemase family protein [uncultured Castellaniella sp.]
MDILLLNPNTSLEMTRHIVREARQHVPGDVTIVPATARFGGAVIASRVSYAIAAHAGLDAYVQYHGRVDVVVVACFGDPGLEALRELASVPVVGLLESSVASAAFHQEPFAIITAGAAWVPMLGERMLSMPHADLARGIFAVDTTGLDITRNPAAFTDMMQSAVDDATRAGARTIILGGSALSGFGGRLRASVRLIDPLAAAMAQAVQAGLASEAPRAPPVPGIAYHGVSRELASLLAGHAV